MAIAYGTSGQNGYAPASSVNFNNITLSGTDRLLVAYVMIQDTGSTKSVSSMTYDGVSMTKLTHVVQGNYRIEMWYLIAPNTTTNATLTINLSGSPSTFISVGWASYTGVKQASFPDSSNTGTVASGTSISVSTTTVDDNCWLVGMERGGTPVAGTATTIRQNAGADMAVIDSNGAKTPAGSYALAITDIGSAAKSMIVASIAPQTSTAWTKDLTEVITLEQTQLKQPTKLVTETVVLNEIFSRLSTALRTITETITLVDTTTPVKIATKAILETVTLVDTISAKITARVLTEVITLVETFSKTVMLSKTFLETIVLVDTVSFIKILNKEFTEAITLTDNQILDTAKAFTETITLEVTQGLAKVYNRTLTEVATLVDTIGTVRTKIITLIDSITLVDSLGRIINKVLTETVSLTLRILILLNGKDVRYRSKYQNRPGGYRNKYLDF